MMTQIGCMSESGSLFFGGRNPEVGNMIKCRSQVDQRLRDEMWEQQKRIKPSGMSMQVAPLPTALNLSWLAYDAGLYVWHTPMHLLLCDDDQQDGMSCVNFKTIRMIRTAGPEHAGDTYCV